MNRFLGLSITRQACLAVSLPIFTYIAYDNWTNDTPLNDHVALVLITAVPITAYILIPHAKKSTLSKAARAYNDGL